MERSTHWLTGLLVLAIAGLGTVVVLELAGSVAIAPEVTAAAPPAGAVEAPVGPAKFLPPPERQFDEISNRPLFFPSRRPFVPPATTDSEPATTDDPTSIELIGVLLSEHGRAVLVQPKGQPGAHWVREQQTVAGWLVEEITAESVRLRDGDRVETVKLRADRARPAAKSDHKRKSAAPKDGAPAANAEQAQTSPAR